MRNVLVIIFLILIQNFFSVCLAKDSLSEIKSVKPDFIKMRHSETIRVEVNEDAINKTLSVIPGGVYIEQAQEIDISKIQQNETNLHPACTSLLKKEMQQPIRSILAIKFNQDCITTNTLNEIQYWKRNNKQFILASTLTLNSRVHQIVAYNSLLLLANGQTGLTVLEVNNNNIQWHSSYNKLGNVIKIANDGPQVLVADDEGILTIVDISGSNRPLLISDFYLGEVPQTLKFSSGKAYVTTDKKRFTINFESQSSPLISTLGVNQGGSRRSYIDKDTLYVADWFSGLHLYDISQPHSPRLISSYHTPGSPKGVIVRNNIAYVADDDHGLQIIDVEQAESPKLISNLPLEGLAYTMKLRGNTLFLASHYGGFHIIDVTLVQTPKVVGSVNTPGKSWALALKDNFLFVADDQIGLLVFDISQVQSPQLISQFNPGGFAEDIIIQNNLAFLAFFDLGLFILDISDAKNIKILSQLKTPGSARGIDIEDNLLYLASWEAGVSVIDIQNKESPRLLSQFDTNGATWGLSVKNKMVYAMDWWGGIKIIDASNSNRLRQISKYQTAGEINDVFLYENFLLTAHGARGFQVYESTNALNPVWASGVDIVGPAIALDAKDGLAVIASEDAGINLVNIQDPFQPKWLSKFQLREKIVDVKILSKTVAALSENGKVFHVDISQPEYPEFIHLLTTNIIQIFKHNNSLWCLDENGGLNEFVASNSNLIKLNKSFKLSDMTTAIAIDSLGLIAIENQRELVSYEIIENIIRQRSRLSLSDKIIDLLPHNDKIYVTTGNRLLNLVSRNKSLKITSQYPSTHRIEKIAATGDSIFFSGESLIASGQLLPKLAIHKEKDGFTINIPKNMPLGTYHLALNAKDGSQSILRNAFEIGFPKFKPKFSMEDLKKKLKEKNFSGKAPATP